MGLSQNIRFQYDSREALEAFLQSLEDPFVVKRNREAFTITEPSQSFTFEIWIEPFGLYTHRSGEYFQFLGILVETLVGEYGPVEIEDQ